MPTTPWSGLWVTVVSSPPPLVGGSLEPGGWAGGCRWHLGDIEGPQSCLRAGPGDYAPLQDAKGHRFDAFPLDPIPYLLPWAGWAVGFGRCRQFARVWVGSHALTAGFLVGALFFFGGVHPSQMHPPPRTNQPLGWLGGGDTGWGQAKKRWFQCFGCRPCSTGGGGQQLGIFDKVSPLPGFSWKIR